MDTLNLDKYRKGGEEYVSYQIKDIRKFLQNYQITLLGEMQEYRGRRDMCRADNDVLCAWQRTSNPPQNQQSEGFDCFQKTGYGYCPKLQHKRRVPDLYATKLGDAGSERRKVKELRERYLAPLMEAFGTNFAGENGLIRTVRGHGYALAASLRDAEG